MRFSHASNLFSILIKKTEQLHRVQLKRISIDPSILV